MVSQHMQQQPPMHRYQHQRGAIPRNFFGGTAAGTGDSTATACDPRTHRLDMGHSDLFGDQTHRKICRLLYALCCSMLAVTGLSFQKCLDVIGGQCDRCANGNSALRRQTAVVLQT